MNNSISTLEVGNLSKPTSLGAIFCLSGEEITLPQAEIRALVQTYEPNFQIETIGSRLVQCKIDEEELIQKISERASFCRFGGLLLAKDQSLDNILDGVKLPDSSQKTFAVDSLTLDMDQCGDVGAKIKSKTGAKVSLKNPDQVYQVERTENDYVLGFTNYGYKKFSWRSRRPRSRKFFLPSAIYPKLARTLVNLSRVRENEFFLDPFCGTGSLLIESSLMGMRTTGIEITRWIARGAVKNMKGLNLDYDGIIRANSATQFLPLKEMDGISTDVPYGRASSTKGRNTQDIIENFLLAASQIIKSQSERKKYCVVMHPSTIGIKEILEKQGNLFQLTEQHLLYVHRNLTRAISILERTTRD